MNDRELLEMAAKAGDYEIFRRFSDGRIAVDTGNTISSDWNPINNSVENFALFVDLRFTVCVRDHEVEVFDQDGYCFSSVPVGMGDDIEAAARLAVVKAAASIGKEMP